MLYQGGDGLLLLGSQGFVSAQGDLRVHLAFNPGIHTGDQKKGHKPSTCDLGLQVAAHIRLDSQPFVNTRRLMFLVPRLMYQAACRPLMPFCTAWARPFSTIARSRFLVAGP